MTYGNVPYGNRERTLQYLRQQIEQAGPLQQVVMLIDGAIRFCLQAKDAIGRKDIQERHNANKRAIDIILHLVDMLDVEKGGEPAKRLYAIYMSLARQLMQVDFKNDPAICDAVVAHLRSLRSAWAQMPAGGAGVVVAPKSADADAVAALVRNAVA